MAISGHRLYFSPGQEVRVSGDVCDTYRTQTWIHDSVVGTPGDDVLGGRDACRVQYGQAVVIHGLITIVEIDRNEAELADDEIQRVGRS